MRVVISVLFLGCLLGCRVKLSSESLNRKYKAEKIDKKLFQDLPVEVKDTISGIFQWFINENSSPCEVSSIKLYPKHIVLDSNYSSEGFNHVNRAYWAHNAKFWQRNGTTFLINKQKFFIPIECPYIINMTIFQDQLYIMGELGKEHEMVFDCKSPDYMKVYYEDYYFWIIDLKK